jgi:hypothetical protein
MHIIFGSEQADKLANKYTVLELDTFEFGSNGTVVTAYCAVENIPFGELSMLEQTRKQHEQLMLDYRSRNWMACLQAIEQLNGKWRGELDSFYEDLSIRVNKNLQNAPADNWTSVIQK